MTKLQVINPATQLQIGELDVDDAAKVAEKLARARTAQPAWAALPLQTRCEAMARFKDSLAAQRDDLALLLTQEMGKPISQSRNEINALSGRIDFFLRETAAVVTDEVVFTEPGLQERIGHEPLGVIANVSAWNYPYFVGSNVFVPALLTGNAVLYKPSELTPLTGLRIAALLHGAGVPEAVFVPVIGAGPTGSALVGSDVDGIFFTGSHATGEHISKAAAGRFVRVQLELGGKDPTYVCDDVDVAAAAAGLADGAMYNAGQSCCSVERIYVHERVAAQFLDAFVAVVRGFKIGDPEDDETYLGPLARPSQIEFLEAQVRDAVAKGARILCGGGRLSDKKGPYFAPTVLTEVNHKMAVMRDESFGPVIGIMPVTDDEQAIGLMNDTAYGLTAGVYTQDRARAESLLHRVNAGSVYWNCCDRVSPRLPWTGRRHSGMGSTLSREGIRAFVQPKAWHLRG